MSHDGFRRMAGISRRTNTLRKSGTKPGFQYLAVKAGSTFAAKTVRSCRPALHDPSRNFAAAATCRFRSGTVPSATCCPGDPADGCLEPMRPTPRKFAHDYSAKSSSAQFGSTLYPRYWYADQTRFQPASPVDQTEWWIPSLDWQLECTRPDAAKSGESVRM